MNSRSRILLSLLALFSLNPSARGAGVSVGNSSLIGALDYSDTFTIGTGTTGSRYGTAYTTGAFPLPAALLPVENSYGNPARNWSGSKWSLNNDAVFLNGTTVFPGGSGAGSVSGMTQTGPSGDWGIEYNLRNQFVVQFDAVQFADRVDLTISNARDGLAGANGLSIFFRANGTSNLGNSAEIGLYNPALGELLTTLDTGLADVDVREWHNYAVSFDLVAMRLGIYVDEIQLGVLDLNTLGGPKYGGGTIAAGAFAGIVSAATNDAISFGAGGAGADRVWTDNFQVGAPVPEPGVALLGLTAVSGAAFRRRRAAAR